VNAGELVAHRAVLGGQLEQPPVGIADGALGLPERVGGFRFRLFGLGELLLQPLDASAQLLEVARRVVATRNPGQEQCDDTCGCPRPRPCPDLPLRLKLLPVRLQALAFPWAATALTAAAMCAWSPR
jgi:hypothetical protein